MLKNTIIYIFPYSITAWDAKRFGFDFFIRQGIDFKVLDLSPLVSSRVDVGKIYLQEDYIKKIKDYKELENELQKYAKHAVFIDGINGIAGFRWQSRHIFKLFKKYNIRYVIVEIGSLPLQAPMNAKKLFDKFKKIFQIKKLFAYLKWRVGKYVIDLQTRYLHRYQLPAKIFVGKTDLLQSYLNRYALSHNCVIPIHSFDYDRYLEYQNNLKKEVKETDDMSELNIAALSNNKRYCVFLDQGLVHHSDFGKSISFCPVTANNYFPSMKRFFDKIEALTGLKVVIAANPRVNYDNRQIFGDRLIIKDKTIELVAESSLVLAHNSTSVNFAVLFDKPLLFLKTFEMLNAYGFASLIDNMATLLGAKTICIDDYEDLNKINLLEYNKWQRNFSEYKYKYVMTQGLADKITWQFVLDELS